MNACVMAILLLMLVAAVVKAQTATPYQIERSPTAQASPRPTKNPHAMHHHFDVRHPHKSTRPKLNQPADKPD